MGRRQQTDGCCCPREVEKPCPPSPLSASRRRNVVRPVPSKSNLAVPPRRRGSHFVLPVLCPYMYNIGTIQKMSTCIVAVGIFCEIWPRLSGDELRPGIGQLKDPTMRRRLTRGLRLTFRGVSQPKLADGSVLPRGQMRDAPCCSRAIFGEEHFAKGGHRLSRYAH